MRRSILYWIGLLLAAVSFPLPLAFGAVLHLIIDNMETREFFEGTKMGTLVLIMVLILTFVLRLLFNIEIRI